MLPPDVALSDLGFTVEDVRSNDDPKIVFPRGGVRVGLGGIAGLSGQASEAILTQRRRSRSGRCSTSRRECGPTGTNWRR